MRSVRIRGVSYSYRRVYRSDIGDAGGNLWVKTAGVLVGAGIDCSIVRFLGLGFGT